MLFKVNFPPQMKGLNHENNLSVNTLLYNDIIYCY